MKRETLLWTIVFVIGVAALGARYAMTPNGFGKVYVEPEPERFVQTDDGAWVDYDSAEILDGEMADTPFVDIPADRRIEWTRYESAKPIDFFEAEAADPNQTTYELSKPRTFGIWMAAFFTLAIFSFLYKDNPLYKIAEAVVVGVSAGYWMVVGFWDVIVPNLMAKLLPGMVQSTFMPGLETHGVDLQYLVPLVLGIMLIWRLVPHGAWISRWPLAFIIGTTAGIRLVGFIEADFLSQINNSIVPLYVTDPLTGDFSFGDSLRNLLLVIGVLTCLVYFFFSIEHKGIVGKTARVGIWFLMVTFGAAFGYTVMGRIALLAIRIEFLFDDWLWLIDPTGQRSIESAVGMILPAFGMG